MKFRRKLHDYESVDTLRTDSQFRKAYARNQADHTALNDAFIVGGRGHWRPNHETAKAAKEGDPLALALQALTAESRALSYRAEHWYGRAPHMI